MNPMLHALVQLVFIVGAAPFWLGVINRVKAWVAGRTGPPTLQLYYDLWKLFQKEIVLSRTSSWIFYAGPALTLAACIAAALFIPIGFHSAPFSFTGDFILYVYLMALGRFFTVNAAMDTGSAFEGMGAVREVSYASLAEPTIFVIFLTLAKMAGSLSLSAMLLSPGADHHPWQAASLVLITVSWFVVLLVENCRIPFDDPNTHLELTMVHEVMVLDHSGPLFGLIQLGAAVKLSLAASVLVSIVLPKLPLGSMLGWPLYLCGMALCMGAVGAVESSVVRLRIPNVPVWLLVNGLLAVFGMALLMR